MRANKLSAACYEQSRLYHLAIGDRFPSLCQPSYIAYVIENYILYWGG